MSFRLIFCFIFALAPLLSWAQGSTWGLTNTSDNTLYFETHHPASQTWQKQTIAPRQRLNYTFSSGYVEGKFRISTPNRGYVEYRVRGGGQYTVGWDRNKGVWDLKLASAGPAPNMAMQNPGNAAPGGPAPAYRIRNGTNQTLNFETLDPARGTWKQQTAFPHQTTAFTFTSGATRGKIRIGTQGRGFKEYDVNAGAFYSLTWNQQQQMWDFRSAPPPAQGGA